MCQKRLSTSGTAMEEKLNLDLEDFSSEPFLDVLVKAITEQDPYFLIGIFVAVAVVIITIGKHECLGLVATSTWNILPNRFLTSPAF